ncbi:DUF2202 domain-containing protein [Litoribaculum gwangyangense]|uniref:DUF2202 domain-containing protein n=1 Tax=Litoribaculum gwangyangense TaxID=1130722 RepID=A0ABP9CG28_9FLAO
MKKLKATPYLIIVVIIMFAIGCSDHDKVYDTDSLEITLSQSDKEALLFMLEEEKLARDTYLFLDNIWSINPFSNIKNSEQNHMDSIESLLVKYQINYDVLPLGEFKNQDLQSLYNQFQIDGILSMTNALKIGATIEDLDIVDLQNFINATNNLSIISVFQSLQCGSKNHLKSFVSSLENINDSYTPQFLSNEEFKIIIESSQEKCKKN